MSVPGLGRPADRGSATLWVLTAGLLLLAASGVGAEIGAVRVARHQAWAAADLAALAGAARVAQGALSACAHASALAAANGARLRACAIDGIDLLVTVEVPVRMPAGRSRSVTSTARAGPLRGR